MAETTAVVSTGDPMKDFQNRVIEKLKIDIGSLLPEEGLKKLVERAVDETFFQERVTNPGRNSWEKPEVRQSWFVEAIAAEAKPMLAAEVKKFVDERKDVLEKALNSFLNENNLLLLAIGQLQYNTTQQIQGLLQIVNELERKKADKQG